MNTLQEVLTESTTYLEEFVAEKPISKEKRVNSFLDNVLKLHKKIDDLTAYFETGLLLLEKFTWVTDKGTFSKEDYNDIYEIKIQSKEVLKQGVKDYVFFNNNFKELASKNIKALKNTLDDFKETTTDVLDVILINYNDKEFNDIEERLNKL